MINNDWKNNIWGTYETNYKKTFSARLKCVTLAMTCTDLQFMGPFPHHKLLVDLFMNNNKHYLHSIILKMFALCIQIHVAINNSSLHFF